MKIRVIGRIVRVSLAVGFLLSLIQGEGALTWGSECKQVVYSIPDYVQTILGADATFYSDLKNYSAVEVFKEDKGTYKLIATYMKLTVISVGPQYEGRFTMENGGLILKEVQLSDMGRYCLKFLHEDTFAWEMQLNEQTQFVTVLVVVAAVIVVLKKRKGAACDVANGADEERNALEMRSLADGHFPCHRVVEEEATGDGTQK
ncbi:uncharacterized protein LOC102360363 [Latimeria chalumnae]|uniref:uncharacterized protein LOC102360363 n=1 Tax=Latimeria chalumnae TaxID=7897 RepID=UPI0003C1A731|nr:PREDICTED: uncharacterized protein LOC102360363 [Latimeria chalumnae]|eukprot:XP_006012124.1 PREDICTED: uncharacterized protein LOC102360363 [Latimeria chalumnae]